jgi:hypothetical protein
MGAVGFVLSSALWRGAHGRTRELHGRSRSVG